MSTAPAGSVVQFLEQRKRLPIDGDGVEVRRGLRVEVCASALGETIDREVAGRGQDVELGVAVEFACDEQGGWSRARLSGPESEVRIRGYRGG